MPRGKQGVQDRFLTIKEAAEYFKVSESAMYRRIDTSKALSEKEVYVKDDSGAFHKAGNKTIQVIDVSVMETESFKSGPKKAKGKKAEKAK